MKPTAYLLLPLALAGCAGSTGPHATLYRSSQLSSERVHWASFDADEADRYNRENCELAARLLNRNLEALNGGRAPMHFWCEDGGYKA